MRGMDIAREVLGLSAIQLQSNLKKTGTRHVSTRVTPEFGGAVYVDFMPTVPGVAIGPVLLVMEYSGDFVVPVELDSMRLDDVIVGVRRAIWRMDLITRKKVSIFHVDAETVCAHLRFREALGKDGIAVIGSDPDSRAVCCLFVEKFLAGKRLPQHLLEIPLRLRIAPGSLRKLVRRLQPALQL